MSDDVKAPESSTKSATPRDVAPAFDAREEAIKRNMQRRLAVNAGSAAGVSVANGASSHAVTFPRREFDALYGVAVMPTWSTTVRVAAADKSATGFVVRFGTAAGATDSIDWLVFRGG